MSLILTKNGLTDLDVFFYKDGLNNIHRPSISYLKIDSSSRVEPIYHIGFEENMGYGDSYKIHAGVMVFEVLEGYPLQSLLFFNNSMLEKSKYKHDLTDLDPIDFYCLQKEGKDPYGDFVIRNLKFISTRTEQGVDNPVRQLVAEFVCTEVKPFKIPYFFNSFKSDNYEWHIIRRKEEIEQIKEDIMSSEIPQSVKTSCAMKLKNSTGSIEADDLCYSLEEKYNLFIKQYKANGGKVSISNITHIQHIAEFIDEFYRWKNRENMKNIKSVNHLEFLQFKGGE